MIKLFRNIRQRLLSEGKTGRYFKYAIGEIILVVIGILLALKINNWNEERKQRNIEQEYLLSLQIEFNTNLDKINTSITENEKILNSINSLLTLFDNDVLDTLSNNNMNQLFRSVFGNQMNFKPSTGVLNDMISSGNLKLIINQKLRQRLASFDSSLEFLKLQENNTIVTRTNLKTIFYRIGSVRNMAGELLNLQHKSISEKISNKMLFRSVEFENYLLDRALLHKSASCTLFFGGL